MQEAVSYAGEQGLPQFTTVSPRLLVFQRGVREGGTIDKLDRAGLGWICYERVGGEVLELLAIQGAA